MTLKERVKKGERLVGMYVQLSDISIARIAAMAGYDFIWVDTEHSYMSYETLLGHVMAIRAEGVPVVVRAPQNDLTAAKKILEMGVDGIIFPMVRSAAEAKAVTDFTFYPPYGQRGFGPMNAIDYGFTPAFEYTKKNMEELCCFIQIEHKDTVECLDEIMQNPYIDGYIFGPNDLSGSYGMLGEIFSDFITGVIRDTVDRLHKAGKYVGIASGGYSEEILAHWSGFGPEMLSAGADFDYLRDGARRNRETLERIHKGK
ncbi:MAG: aldolase [Clostridia bacterium]|nr:aldolase [Clostridia bacterium]